ncbi:MAG: sporulation protein YtfJ [Firmicutes bacterium]|jgi:sporulation protein YtfJ|nr:sporulation protein YtfJ [Bacillota bacterium]
MAEHPIQGLMITAMENLREMVDVNKIVGDAVETPDGHVIIPVSRVSFGFVAGGTEFDVLEEQQKGAAQNQSQNQNQSVGFPFGGGSGGGVSIQPIAFLVVGTGEVRLLPVDRSAVFDRLIDLAPQLFQHLEDLIKPDRSKSNITKL